MNTLKSYRLDDDTIKAIDDLKKILRLSSKSDVIRYAIRELERSEKASEQS